MRGRPYGVKEKRSEKKAAVVRENATRPRGRWANTEERARIDEAKKLLREYMPEGARKLIEILRDTDTPRMEWLQAFRLAADRAGLMPQLDLTSNGEVLEMQPLVIIMGEDAEAS